MENVRFGSRRVPGFGVGIAPQATFVKPATTAAPALGSSLTMPSGKVGAFLSGAAVSAISAVAATALFGDGFAALSGTGQRLARNWRPLVATAVVGGVVGAVVA